VRIELLIHVDVLPDGSLAWWAESEQLPGFAAQESSLRDLIPLASSAARGIASERGLDVSEIALRLTEDDPDSRGDDVQYHLPEGTSPQTSGESRALVREPRELAPV
jgi:pyruvate/2-oxoglutarate dehydrogenase complex dihydrolipoamide acyltransferase (E2) component